MSNNSNARIKWLAAGIIFAALWASAATATKMGLTSAQPLVIAVVRFGMAAAIMLFFAHVVKRYRLPHQQEWKQIALYGLLNITIYLGLYVIAMQTVSAGIGALAIATNPVYISFLSVFFLKKKLTGPVLLSIVICMAGVVCAAWPLFANASVTTSGLLLLLLCMLSYSAAAIYFSARNWNDLQLLTINGWQTLLGGLFLLPFTLFLYKGEANHFDQTFWWSVAWLAIPVSIAAVQLWLWLLQTNPVRAGLWLFLCPLFGFVFAALWMHEPISSYTVAGVVLVNIGLFLSKINTKKSAVVFD
ncbi:DMT family transporter [Flavihumibacter petaseus]|uniref:Putative DMT family transporter n=1 Tax=Flavihumibacter petaseus NBRC 106054 TaxID=1220578 RepID=A0A0E9N3Z6_9BACT|nr:DMT family transporter [Flavihumibacter petaseus]GAO44707.1 putative DMT family transporter [Flavihumibacter petaseus NBRC 106054]